MPFFLLNAFRCLITTAGITKHKKWHEIWQKINNIRHSTLRAKTKLRCNVNCHSNFSICWQNPWWCYHSNGIPLVELLHTCRAFFCFLGFHTKKFRIFCAISLWKLLEEPQRDWWISIAKTKWILLIVVKCCHWKNGLLWMTRGACKSYLQGWVVQS